MNRRTRPVILTVINLFLLALILYFLWFSFLPLFRFSGMYTEITAAVTMISIAFVIAVAISIYIAWRAYRRSIEEGSIEEEISL
ncbi:MAG: hypothetical protein RMJ00_00095 [Nitrososphaerota archaeon]|nr:hypothetical protein [Candidatus Bathyarchaeota archaeon]MCX8161378.1 hypothetical protein [Candidatus Bathyarchaeota archaeon]MDW8061094.1 hypothetical protein [Nitrososphaerota archaeon]